ncbi:MAG: S41 family peptidase [Ignavibacteriales bacterium]|nr:S41 family peptidase [Ignavibacteriales bacterium]
MKNRFSITTVGFIFIISLLLGMQIDKLVSGDSIFEQLSKFKDVLSYAEKYYVEEVDTPKLVESAINGMLSSLDPHSVYIPASQMQRVTEDFQGNFEGIGVEFEVLNDTLMVVNPLAGGPSEQLGILPNDKIVKIDDTSAIGIKREDVPKKLRGPKGTHVKVTIFRAGEKELIDFDIIRDKIPIYSVDVSYMLDDKTGYIAANRFSATTYSEFKSALDKLNGEGMKRLILDLRGNTGGYMDQAIKMVNELLPDSGKMIVYTKARIPQFVEENKSNGFGKYGNVPIIVIVNSNSASASEIVSGAIQDLDRGLVVGETTFGKGLVQRQFELSDKSAFRLTIARYYTPSGRLIQRPYGKDADSYRRAAYERDEQEGDNVEHKEEIDSTKPKFKTLSGRTVYGGGGITPDYIIKAETTSVLFRRIWGKGLFREYPLVYLDKHGKEIHSEYGKDLKKFLNEFDVSSAMIDDFKKHAIKKDVSIDDALFEKDIPVFKMRIKAEIARQQWGNEGVYSVFQKDDNQLQKALSLFPEAEKISKLQ